MMDSRKGQFSVTSFTYKMSQKTYLKRIFCSMRITWKSKYYWRSSSKPWNRLFWKLNMIQFFTWLSEIHMLYRSVGNVMGSNYLTSGLSWWSRKYTSGKSWVRFSYSTLNNFTVKKWLGAYKVVIMWNKYINTKLITEWCCFLV